MYKLLLVDDETATRAGILKSIRWQEIGIREVRTQRTVFRPLILQKTLYPTFFDRYKNAENERY